MEIVPKLIGLTGFKTSGKDTVADYMVSAFGFVKIEHAEPIRRALAAMFSVDISVFLNPETKELPLPELKGRTPRFLQQTLGTEWGREIVDEDIWAWLADRAIERHNASGARQIVLSDVRFQNEAEVIKQRGGQIWRVERPGIVRVDAHPSEKGLPPEFIDLVVENDGTKAMLYTKVGVNLDAIDRQARRRAFTGAPF